MNSSETMDRDSDSLNPSSPSYFRYGSLICGVALVPVAILGIIGNCIAASVFSRQRTHAAASSYSLYATSPAKESRSSINVLLIGLTVVDTVLLILATPLCATMAIYNFDPDRSERLLRPIAYMTLITYTPAMMAQCASVWTMVLISLERYMAICRPLSTRAFGSVGKTKAAFIGVVGAAVLYNACRFGEYRMNEFGNGTESILRDNELYVNVYMTWSYFTLVFALPFLVLLVANTMIARTIVIARRNRRTIVPLSQHNRREQRTALMMAAVVLAYMCCNTLALLLNGWEAVGGREGASAATSWLLDSELFSFLSDLNNLLIEAHSSLTFLVYFRFSGHFRGFVYYQLRFLCYLRDGTLKTASHWGQRPAETLVENSRDLSLLLASQKCREQVSSGPDGHRNSIGRGSTSMEKSQYRMAQNRRLLTVPRRKLTMRHSAYVAVARGSLESHLDPFHI